MSRYLVTGGAGFIGSHLVELIIEQGHEVIVLDDLSTGKKKNLPADVPLIVGDVAHWPTVKEAFSDIDGCFHLAAIASVEKSNLEWRRTHHVNGTGIVNIFEAARVNRTPVVYASSAAIYGNNPQVLSEQVHGADPLSAYATDKYFCELSGRVAAEIHGVPNTGIRFFNVYGPRQDPQSPYSGVIAIFVDRIRKRQEITIFGDGTQVRDFIYVKDAVRIMHESMNKLLHHGQKGFCVLNACTNHSISVLGLAKTIEELVGWQVLRKYCEARPGDIHSSVGSKTYAQSWLGINNNTDLRDGLTALLTSQIS